jgi:2,6-dihydroxypyridine 3-monooxygenase
MQDGTEMPPLRVIVMGGSLAGLASAVFLRRAGVDAIVFERSQRPLIGRGAGIVLHPSVFRALDRDPQEISARADVLRYLDDEGAVVSEQPCAYRFISYAALHRVMLEGLELDAYHLGAEVRDFHQDGDGVDVEVAGWGSERGQVLVCADGIHSTARRKLAPDVEPVYAGYVGWRGTVVESHLSDEAFSAFEDAITYCVLPNSHILVYPIPSLGGSLEPGERLINWVWYRNAGPHDLDELLLARDGVRHEVSVGSGDVREEVLDQLLDDAAAALPPQLAELVAKSPEPFVQVVFDIAVPHMAYGRIALIGDAAFALRPHVAVGTAKAAEDAWTLATAIAEDGRDVPAALRRWEPAQVQLARSAMQRARDAGARSQFENRWRVGDPLPFGLYEAGDSLLAPSG